MWRVAVSALIHSVNNRMSALEQFLGDNPDMAEKPYGDAMAASSYPDVSLGFVTLPSHEREVSAP